MITEAERETWRPAACPLCGVPQWFSGDWFEVHTLGDPEPLYAPGESWCMTPRCGKVCLICRREIGDVHGPHCGDLMLSKLATADRPHVVDAGDCR